MSFHGSIFFSIQENLTETAIFGLIVGVPVRNCQPDSDSSITSTSEGTITIGDTWSVNTQIGLSLPNLVVSAGFGWSRTDTVMWSQSIMITVEPGQMVCPQNACMSYSQDIDTTTCRVRWLRIYNTNEPMEPCILRMGAYILGFIRAGNINGSTCSQGFPLISNQPISIVSYGAEIVACNSSIPANVSDPLNCTSNSQTLFERDTVSTGFLIPTIATGLLVVLLLVL